MKSRNEMCPYDMGYSDGQNNRENLNPFEKGEMDHEEYEVGYEDAQEDYQEYTIN